MSRNSCILVLGAVFEVAVCHRDMQCFGTQTCDPFMCESTPEGCQLQQTDPVLNPLDKKCGSYNIIEGNTQCQIATTASTDSSHTPESCERLCTADDECIQWTFFLNNARQPCKLCSTTVSMPTFPVVGTITGTANCLNCHEAVSAAQCANLACVMADGNCERDCQPEAPAADGSCSYFCPQEGKKCKVDGPSKLTAGTAEACKDLCSSDPACNVFEFDTDAKMCQFCATDELVDAGVGYQHYWVAGERTCASTTTSVTTQLPVSTAPVTTMAPSESMTADVGASSEIAKALLKKLDVKSDNIDVAGEHRLNSATVFGGGALVGASAALVVLFAARRQFDGAGAGLLYQEA